MRLSFRLFIIVNFLLAFCASPYPASEAMAAQEKQATIVTDKNTTTELWEGKALTAKFRVGMCYERNGKARGVLFLRHATGQEDVYHLYGTLLADEFSLSHGSGHSFSGVLTSPDTMKGKAKLKNGLTLSLSGRRVRNVPLAAEDCAPLPR